jgi:hypothetical protein
MGMLPATNKPFNTANNVALMDLLTPKAFEPVEAALRGIQ